MTEPDPRPGDGAAAALAHALIDDAVYSLIRRRAEVTPTAVMAIDEHERVLKFGTYHDEVLATAGALIERGVVPGMRVAWQLPASFEALILAGALGRLGVCQILLLPQYRKRELEHIVDDARPQILIVREGDPKFDYFAQAREIAAGRGELRVLRLEDIARGSGSSLPAYVAPAADEPRWIIYTSGTTGSPKGAMHSDHTVTAGSRQTFSPAELLAGDRITINYPLAHIGGVIVLCTLAATGCSAVLVERFDAENHVKLYRKHRVTVPGNGPPFFRLYLQIQRTQPGKAILPDARVFWGGGAPKPPMMHDQVRTEIGGEGILTGYGMSECPMLTAVVRESPNEKKARTDGLPVQDTDLRLVDETGNDVPSGTQGEILVKGPQLFLGYVDPRLNSGAFDERGYYRTGDLGVFDSDGYLRLTGRLKDLIIRKGENISAKEIEDLLAMHPAVAEVAVVGLPDPERGEICCAVVIPNESAGRFGLAELRDHLAKAGLAGFKIPERLEMLDELPRNVMGKVQKKQLRVRYGDSSTHEISR